MVNKKAAPIDVILGDGNPLVLSAMGELFERDPRFSLVATTSTAEDFIGIAMRIPAAIGVIDWHLPNLGGARLIEVLREQAAASRIVVYGQETGDLARQSMAAGAAGFASRAGDVDTLLDTCENVAAGRMVFPFVDIRELQQDPINTLSRKERVLLEALAKGLSNRELAQEIGISGNTVKFHLSNIYDKLSVRNRAQAIALYYSAQVPKMPAFD